MRSILFFVLAMFVATLGVSILLFVDGITEGDSWVQYLAAAILFLVFLYVWRMRRQRQRSEERFDDSLRGDLEKALSQINYTISRVRTLIWWYVLPTTAAYTLSIYAQDKPLWLIGLTLLVFALGILVGEWEIRTNHLAKKRDLESARAMLIASDD